MDVDSFLAVNRPSWDRLAQLTAGYRTLSGPEVKEFAALYQKVSGDLSYAQANFSDPAIKADLTRRVATTAAVLYSVRRSTWRTVGHFFRFEFPLAVWQARWMVLVSALTLFVPAVATGVWIAHSPSALDLVGSSALRAAYVGHDFRHYYSAEPSVDFAWSVYLNNVLVAFEAFAGGVFFGLLTVYFLFTNGLNLGVAAGLFYAAHRPGEFWGLVTPHGLLEMSSVVLAGAAGLKLGWALVRPGDMTRSRALYRQGRSAIVLALGTVLTLAVAGTIEGFVTGSSLPTVARVGIGIVVELTFLTWVIGCGRSASRAQDGEALTGPAPGRPQ